MSWPQTFHTYFVHQVCQFVFAGVLCSVINGVSFRLVPALSAQLSLTLVQTTEWAERKPRLSGPLMRYNLKNVLKRLTFHTFLAQRGIKLLQRAMKLKLACRREWYKEKKSLTLTERQSGAVNVICLALPLKCHFRA